MRYEEMNEVIELREDGLWRKAYVRRNGRRYKEKRVEDTGVNGKGYTTVRIKGRKEYYHRVVACLALKMDIPPGIEVDHWDGNRTNNSPDNLRLVTHWENMQKRDCRPLRQSTS